MNIWLILVLFFLLLSQGLETVASVLNLRALQPQPPKELADLFDSASYRKSIDYLRANIRLALLQGGVATTAILFFLLGGGFNAIDLYLRSWTQQEMVVGLLFIGTILLLMFFLDLPFSLYKTFIIEERFGFNRTTIRLYLSDLAKMALLALFLGSPLLAFVLWFFAKAGPYGWLYCWGAVSLFSLALQILAPVLILPLFNKLTPLDEGPVAESIRAFANRQNFPLQGIYTMDGSKRSSKANAFFTGFGKLKKVVFYDTLLEQLSPQEIVAVLAHEIGHYRLHHLPKNIIASLLQSLIMFYLLSLFLGVEEISQAFSMGNASIHASLVFFGLLFSPVSLIISVAFHWLSRTFEYAADRFAAASLEGSEPLVNALKKLSATNFTHLTPHPFMVWLHYSHPPLIARIAGLRLGRDRDSARN